MAISWKDLTNKYSEKKLKERLGDAMWEDLNTSPDDPSEIKIYSQEERNKALEKHEELQSESLGDPCPECGDGNIWRPSVTIDHSKTTEQSQTLGAQAGAGIVIAEGSTTAGRGQAESATTGISVEMGVRSCDNYNCKENYLSSHERRAAVLEMDRRAEIENNQEASAEQIMEKGDVEVDERIDSSADVDSSVDTKSETAKEDTGPSSDSDGHSTSDNKAEREVFSEVLGPSTDTSKQEKQINEESPNSETENDFGPVK